MSKTPVKFERFNVGDTVLLRGNHGKAVITTIASRTASRLRTANGCEFGVYKSKYRLGTEERWTQRSSGGFSSYSLHELTPKLEAELAKEARRAEFELEAIAIRQQLSQMIHAADPARLARMMAALIYPVETDPVYEAAEKLTHAWCLGFEEWDGLASCVGAGGLDLGAIHEPLEALKKALEA